jgi:hypothetical protein
MDNLCANTKITITTEHSQSIDSHIPYRRTSSSPPSNFQKIVLTSLNPSSVVGASYPDRKEVNAILANSALGAYNTADDRKCERENTVEASANYARTHLVSLDLIRKAKCAIEVIIPRELVRPFKENTPTLNLVLVRKVKVVFARLAVAVCVICRSPCQCPRNSRASAELGKKRTNDNALPGF